MARSTALLYYYLTTVDEEVANIWPQPSYKLGKILFLVSRYANIGRIALDIPSLPLYITTTLKSCNAVNRAFQTFVVIGVNFPEAILWIIIYALLGGRPRHLVILLGVYLAFTIPIQVLQGMAFSLEDAVPLTQLQTEMGYLCSWWSGTRSEQLYIYVTYLSFARTILFMTVAVATIVVRFRKQQNALLRVITREGGLYYLSACALNFFNGLSKLSPPVIPDSYHIINHLRLIFIPVLADRLLLKMQYTDGLGTRADMSTLIFEPRGEDVQESVDVRFVEDTNSTDSKS